jgi:PAS domain S-box-containing protein
MSQQMKFIREPAGRVEMDAALLAGLVHASPAVLYSCKVAEDYGTIAVTENARRVLGYAPEDFIADPGFWAVRIHPEDSARVFEEMPRLFRESEQVIEYRFRRANGSYVWLRDQMKLELDEDGKPARILGCWIEINDRNKAAFITEIVGEAAKTKTITTAGGGRYAKQT